MTTESSRFRFSLGSLLIAVTAIGGCLGALQLKFRLLRSNSFMDYARSVIDSLPANSTITLVVIQILNLCLAAMALHLWRKPIVLWAYVAGSTMWLAVIATGYLSPDLFSAPQFVGEAFLSVFFCETTIGLVFALLAFCQALSRRHLAAILTVSVIIVLNLVAELCALVEIDAFGSAIAAAVAN